MVDQNTSSYAGYVTYSGASSGYYYTAYVTFYAKNSLHKGIPVFRVTVLLICCELKITSNN